MDGLAVQLSRQLEAQPQAGLPDWARQLRRDAAGVFAGHGLPSQRLEGWKYTSLRNFERDIRQLGVVAGGTGVAGQSLPLDCDSHVAMVDGQWAAQHGSLAAGVQLLPLTEALASATDGLADLLRTLDVSQPAEALSALNTATLGSGLVVKVPAGVDAGRLLLEWSSSPGADQALFNSRVCLLLGAGARLELVEHYSGRAAPQQASAPGALNVVLQAQLGDAAGLRHVRLQEGDTRDMLFTHSLVRQAAGSRYLHTGLDLAGGLTRHDLLAQLLQPGASCELNGAYLPAGRSHVDLQLAIDHAAPGCHSSQFYRGVLKDRGRAVFRGRVHVWPGADGTEARQSNANLLLSPHAEVDTKPELVIEADEVIASHGATVGQLDETAVFYLRSRGLSEAAARQLLTGAFCRAVIDRLSDAGLRESLMHRLSAALGDGQ